MRAFFSLISALSLSFVSAFAPAAGGLAAQERRYYERPVYGGFEVDVLVGGTPLEKLYGRGRNYVEAIHGAEYELRIRNPLPVRVAVALSVDGLNTIDARRSSSWDSSKWVIEPYQSIRIGGWQMSTERARRFYFTTERDSYAAKLGRASDLGVITAVFYREAAPAVTRRRPRPYTSEERGEADKKDESRAKSPPAPSSAGSGRQNSERSGVFREAPPLDDDYAATGIGRSVDHSVQRISMSLERRPAAETTIRYEYRPALVQLGVLPRPRPVYDPLGRRERAKGFNDPEFCPEP